MHPIDRRLAPLSLSASRSLCLAPLALSTIPIAGAPSLPFAPLIAQKIPSAPRLHYPKARPSGKNQRPLTHCLFPSSTISRRYSLSLYLTHTIYYKQFPSLIWGEFGVF
ncbi:hypothetical protein AMTRI_Chr03g48590 [Amborella trichopoda]